MRHLILSDIHANWHALQAVLSAADGRYDDIVCCGDLVGYGADPNPVLDWARGNVRTVVRGNHDKACCGTLDLEWFNPVARASALWTLRNLTLENKEYLKNLPQGPVPVNGYQILHGSPVDEDEYLVAPQDVAVIAGSLDHALSFFGHTHLQGGFLLFRDRVVKVPKTPALRDRQTLEFESDVSYLLNPGSVGQPRDGDARASFILYDTADKALDYFRVPYDVAGAQARIRDEGLPDMLAERLAVGS